MRLDITALDRELKQGTILPAYVIVGAESYLAMSALALIKDAICGDKGDDLNVTTLSGREARPDVAIRSLRTIPMLGGRPLVIIREGEGIPKDALEAFADYIEAPVNTSTLVVVSTKLDGRSRFMHLAAKHGAVIECKPLFDSKIPTWINMEFKRHRRQISHDAAQFLADMVGSELGQLAQAIERIVLYVGDRRLIEIKDIEEAVSDTHQRTVFEFTDAVGNKNLAKALAHVHNILDGGQSPVLVLNMLARHFRILAKAKEITGRLSDRAEIANYLGVHPFYARNYLDQARNFPAGELRNSFKLLHRCDRSLKSSRLPKERILERAIFALVGKQQVR